MKSPCPMLLWTLFALANAMADPAYAGDAPWKRHTIDDTSRGADGVRLADANGDGRFDIATGWEEGAQVRIYLQPENDRVRSPWPRVTVGRVRSPEDAVFVDVDGDGQLDVASCCEGKTRSVFVHWSPSDPTTIMRQDAWQTTAVPAVADRQMWMFAAPLDGATRATILALGSKGKNASVGLLRLPHGDRSLRSSHYHRLADAGWIMSIRTIDFDRDGDQDIVYSDRKGARRGISWLERRRPNPLDPDAWRAHRIGGADYEVMFMDVGDWNEDGRPDIAAATRNGTLLLLHAREPSRWMTEAIPNPGGARWGKAVRIGDLDNDGLPDLAFTANTNGNRRTPGVMWLKQSRLEGASTWTPHTISDSRGVKFDRIELLDIDHDGDLDLLTCEERDNLGVIWYENPKR